VKRTSLTHTGRKDGYLTTFLIPKKLHSELKVVCPGKQRTRWVLNAIDALWRFDEIERNQLLQADMRLRLSKMDGLPVRLPTETQNHLRDILISFRKNSPELELETSGIVRASIIFHLRHHEGRFLND